MERKESNQTNKIKVPFVIQIFVWSIFEGSFYTGFTVVYAAEQQIFNEINASIQKLLSEKRSIS